MRFVHSTSTESTFAALAQAGTCLEIVSVSDIFYYDENELTHNNGTSIPAHPRTK